MHTMHSRWASAGPGPGRREECDGIVHGPGKGCIKWPHGDGNGVMMRMTVLVRKVLGVGIIMVTLMVHGDTHAWQ